jgi:ketosteroid isomerase-like protein
MKKTAFLLLIVLTILGPGQAQETRKATDDPAHEQLRALQNELVAAVNKGDMDALLRHLDEDVVVTWLNGEVSRKPEGVRKYIAHMNAGKDRRVQSYSTEVEVDEPAHLYGDTAVAFGRSRDHYILVDGRDFTVLTRWTATLVRKDGRWLLAGLHTSASVFDNPILNSVRRTALWTAIACAVVGIVVGFLISWLLRRSRRATSAP